MLSEMHLAEGGKQSISQPVPGQAPWFDR